MKSRLQVWMICPWLLLCWWHSCSGPEVLLQDVEIIVPCWLYTHGKNTVVQGKDVGIMAAWVSWDQAKGMKGEPPCLLDVGCGGWCRFNEGNVVERQVCAHPLCNSRREMSYWVWIYCNHVAEDHLLSFWIVVSEQLCSFRAIAPQPSRNEIPPNINQCHIDWDSFHGPSALSW